MVIIALHKTQHKDSLFLTASRSKDNPWKPRICSFFFYIATIVANIKRHEGSFWRTDNVLFPDLRGGYAGVFIL